MDDGGTAGALAHPPVAGAVPGLVALVEGLAPGVLILTADLQVRYANGAGRRVLDAIGPQGLAASGLGRLLAGIALPAAEAAGGWTGSFRLPASTADPEGGEDLELIVTTLPGGQEAVVGVVLAPVPRSVQVNDMAAVLAAVVAQSTEFIAWHGPIGAEARVNPVAAALVGGGVRPGEPLPCQIRDLFVPESRERIVRDGVPVMHQRGFWHDRLQVRNRDTGEVAEVDWSMFLVHDAEGRVIGTAGMGRDVTARVDAERRQLERSLVLAQEQERRRVAAEIHDDSAQALTAVSLRLQRLRRRITGADARILHEAEEATTAAIARLRRLIFDLHPPALDHGGLAVALEQYLAECFEPEHMPALVTEADGVVLDRAVRAAAYRAAREALINVAKHARALRVEVRLEPAGGGLRVRVEDDGVGFEPDSLPGNRPGHMGLTNCEALIRAVGGWYRLRSAPGEGTTVEFWVPAEPAGT